MPKQKPAQVYIRRCPTYDRERIRALVAEGMAALDWSPQGNVFVKPNVVFAYDPKIYGQHAYTNPGLVGASLEALGAAPEVKRLDLGENTAVGMPTRFCYKWAGYREEMARVRKATKVPVDMFCIDEERRDTVFVGGQVHDTLRIARQQARADCQVYLPKLKCHCVSKMTGAVKLNIGICSDDERSIRHDFLLDDKIVDLLDPGYPDFIVMDAIEVGLGNEALPEPRNLGLLIMGRNPLACDFVGAKLLGLDPLEVPYLARAVERGYGPGSLEEVELSGDITSLHELGQAAKVLGPRDDTFTRWTDVSKELARLNSPMRFYYGPYKAESEELCRTGCVMGLKMFLGFFEAYAGAPAFAAARPVTFVIGRQSEPIDGRGSTVFLIGSCTQAEVRNARKVQRIEKCFTTAGDMMQTISWKFGMKSPFMSPRFLMHFLTAFATNVVFKTVKGRYLQDIGYFLRKGLTRRI